MNLRGQRFSLNISDDEGDTSNIGSSNSFIQDIKERPMSGEVSAPKLGNSIHGFPKHKKHSKILNARRQKDFNGKNLAADTPTVFAESSPSLEKTDLQKTEKQLIDEENRARLSGMSAEQIEIERQELLSQLDPTLIQRLLRRANLDEARGDTGIEPPDEKNEPREPLKIIEKKEVKSHLTDVEQGVPAPVIKIKPTITRSVRFIEDEDEPAYPIKLQPVSAEPISLCDEPKLHFPAIPSLPDLDPLDPSFLENLHGKYFPTLPKDPSKLAWMEPLPTQGTILDQKSSYYPAQASLPASALRFTFRGSLLPPRIARAVPVTKGLHHHGEAPEAAGYTVPELAHLARSVYPAQRCIAFQTLGRLLYRLGRGEWGGKDSDISQGLWRCIEKGHVISTLEQAAATEGGHQGSKAYATEAIWLWQKGGGSHGGTPK